MSDLLLRASNKLDGPRAVTLTLRPPRVAYLIDPADPALALAAVEAACFEWGGRFQFLIPCPPDGEPAPVWARILEKYDPDIVVDLVGADRRYLSVHEDRLGRSVFRWERPLETMALIGPLVYGPLGRWKRERSPQTAYRTLHFHPLRGQPLALPLAFQFGHLERRPMDEKLRRHAAYAAARHADFLEVVQVDPGTLSRDQLAVTAAVADLDPIGFPDLVRGTQGLNEFYTLPGLTREGLPTQEPPYSFGPPDPEREQHDEAYLRRIVVVGNPASVPDLCLAWNLRAQRTVTMPFPMWVAPEWLAEPVFAQRIGMALQTRPGGLYPPPLRWDDAALHLVSASLPTGGLSATFAGAVDRVVSHDETPLDRFFTDRFSVGRTRESIVSFREKVADIPLPDYRVFGDFRRDDWLGYTLSIPGYAAPPGSQAAYPRVSNSASRSAADGIAGFFYADRATDSLLREGTNDGWQLLAGATAQAGYSVAISDKGALAIALFELVDGPVGLPVLASSRVYALLRAMAEIVPRQAVQGTLRRALGRDLAPDEVREIVAALQSGGIGGGQFDRQHRDWSQLRSDLGGAREACETIATWLVERRVLFRGYELACPNCGLRRWYPIDRLADTHRCDGCQIVSSTPVPLQQLQWRYRLNEVVARAVDQGVLPHLHAVGYMRAWANAPSAGRELLGVLPGARLEPLPKSGRDSIEVDFIAIKAGRIIVGECKAAGGELSEAEVVRFAALGRHFNCSRIAYATPTDFGSIPEIIARARAASAPTHIEVWESGHLLDVDPAVGASSSSPEEYLETVARHLRRAP